MYTFDASSMVHAWENYPLENFPPFWSWISDQIDSQRFTMPSVAFDEVGHKFPECASWLKSAGIKRIRQTNDILKQAREIKLLLGIRNDAYHPKGVDENDLMIIATAKVSGQALISDEGQQPKLPAEREKYKIPAVCDLVDVRRLSLIALIREENAVFK